MEQKLAHFEAFLLTHKRVAEHTYSAYRRDVAQCLTFLKTHDCDSLDQLTREKLVEYLAYLRERQINPRSIARKISALRLFFLFLKDHHNFQNSSFDLILPKTLKKLPLYCTVEEMRALLAAAGADTSIEGQRNLVMLKLLYATGLRVSELCNLKFTDVIAQASRLCVKGKGGKMRIIPLHATVTELLNTYLANIFPQLTSGGMTEYLFPVAYAGKLKPLSRQSVWKIIKRLTRMVGMSKPISPHTFRHSLATHSLQKGWDLRSLQLLLGHENIATVQIYTHIEMSHLRSAYNKKHPRS